MELKEVHRYPGSKGQRLECPMFVMVPGPLAPHGWVTDTDADISGLCSSAGRDRRVVLRVPAAYSRSAKPLLRLEVSSPFLRLLTLRTSAKRPG